VDSATAAAQRIIIIDTLNSNLDWSTLVFDSTSHSPTNISFDPVTGTIEWTFDGINLPPNVNPPEGEGWVMFHIDQLSGLPTGTKIQNSASIIFDYNDPVITDTVVNTIDAGYPVSSMCPCPLHLDTNSFFLSWIGQDDSLGSGINYYNIYIAEDKQGPFTPWKVNTFATSSIFFGEYGKEYYFYSIATDGVGFTEMPPDSFDISLSYDVDYKVFLQGPYNQASGYMNTPLSKLDSFPLQQPYDTLPWNYSGLESLNKVPSFVVDWILVELRSSPATVVDRRAVLLLNNGSIVDTNFLGSVQFMNVTGGNYYVAIHHRNHMSVMTANPVILHGGNVIDFSDTLNTELFGGNLLAQIELDSCIFGMIAGDVNKDGQLKYSGPNNDRNLILQRIINKTGLTSISNTVYGYYTEDLNMDTVIKYIGPDNDQALIIRNLVTLSGSTSITNIYNSLVPSGIIASSFICGNQLIDTRDGNSYNTVQIGNQCWMAENLAYLPSISPPNNSVFKVSLKSITFPP